MSTDPATQNKDHVFENYPAGIIVLANLASFSIYALGAMIMAKLGTVALFLYLGLCLGLEVNVLAGSCVNCYYYGKACFSGKGIISSWFFKPGNSETFSRKEVSWLNILPDMLIVLIPAGIGAFLLIQQFQWQVLVLMAGLLVMGVPVTGMIRGSLACCYCRQRILGCPAEKLFQKKGGRSRHPQSS